MDLHAFPPPKSIFQINSRPIRFEKSFLGSSEKHKTLVTTKKSILVATTNENSPFHRQKQTKSNSVIRFADHISSDLMVHRSPQ